MKLKCSWVGRIHWCAVLCTNFGRVCADGFVSSLTRLMSTEMARCPWKRYQRCSMGSTSTLPTRVWRRGFGWAELQTVDTCISIVPPMDMYGGTYVTHSLCDSFTVASLRNYVCRWYGCRIHWWNPRNACYDVTHSLCDSFTVASLRNYVGCMGAEYIGES